MIQSRQMEQHVQGPGGSRPSPGGSERGPVWQKKKKKAAGNVNKEIGSEGQITPRLIAQYKKFGLYSNCNRTMKTF